MGSQIMVLFDSEAIRHESLLYSIELAKESLEKHIEIIKNAGLSVETAVRIGNPRSELVKYVAEAGRFETIVWGAKPDLMRRKDHWLVRMKDTLECPVVTPFIKNDAKSKYAGEQRR
jgi:hypothetical protein